MFKIDRDFRASFLFSGILGITGNYFFGGCKKILGFDASSGDIEGIHAHM